MVARKNPKEIASIERAQTFHSEEEHEGNQSVWLFVIVVGEGSKSQVQLKVNNNFLKQKMVFSGHLIVAYKSMQEEKYRRVRNSISMGTVTMMEAMPKLKNHTILMFSPFSCVYFIVCFFDVPFHRRRR